MRIRFLRRILISLLVALLVAPIPPVQAEWWTSGGSDGRGSSVEEALGPAVAPPVWSIEEGKDWVEGFERSGAQPIAVKDAAGTALYHLAGQYLWRIRIDEQGNRLGAVEQVKGGGLTGVIVNPAGLTPFSTPTYSPESKTLYFGTNNGSVFAYDIQHNELREAPVYNPDQNCRFTSSPAVFRLKGQTGAEQDVVVIGDRPASDNSVGACGHVSVIWGLDRPDFTPQWQRWGGPDEQAWYTPSPVKDPQAPNRFLIGGYGTNGTLLRFEITPTATGFELRTLKSWKQQGITNLAGSLATDGTNLYWTDTAGNLWVINLESGGKPAEWETVTPPIYLPDHISHANAGFVNTKPAIGKDTVYVSLRNVGTGWNGTIPTFGAAGYPGKAGAMVAIDARNGTLKWATKPLEVLPKDRFSPVLNTAPMVMESAGLVMVGDVNGYLRAFSVDTGAPTTLTIDEATCTNQTAYRLLQDAEEPYQGTVYYTQAFGASTDPMAAEPLIIIGVNSQNGAYHKHRLLGLKLQPVYNLKWSGDGNDNEPRPHSFEDLPISDQPVEMNHEVLLEVPDNPFTGKNPTLEQILPAGAKVSWFAVESQQWYKWVSQKTVPNQVTGIYLDETPLSGDLKGASDNAGAAQKGTSVGLQVTARPGMPTDGYIVGVIDVERLAAHGADHYGQMAAKLLALKEAAVGKTAVSCTAAVAEQVKSKDSTGKFISTLADNFLNNHYLIAPDVSLSLEVPSSSGKITGKVGAVATAYVTLVNHSTIPVQGPLRLWVKWPKDDHYLNPGFQWIALKPGETRKIALTFLVSQEDVPVRVRAEFNMDEKRVVEESTYDNNVAEVTVHTDQHIAPSAVSGGGRVIMVPSDCILETDPTTGRLCKNYDKSLNDW